MKKIKPIKPEKLPLHDFRWEKVLDLLTEAHFVLGRFEEITQGVSDPFHVFSDLIHDESLSSFSQNSEKKAASDLAFLENYENTLHWALKEIKRKPLSLSFIKKIHAGIRKGAHEDIGVFRKRQNWIGFEGCKIEEAYFYPPKHTIIDSSMQNLLDYLHFREKDKLVQIAIFFAQFLIIHPFMDANGRVGRILVTLLLYKKKLLSNPLFFTSRYFKENRLHYFQSLYAISSHEKDWEGWVSFFLKGIISEGKENCARAEKLLRKTQK